jgi:hypothetical protein
MSWRKVGRNRRKRQEIIQRAPQTGEGIDWCLKFGSFGKGVGVGFTID